MNSIQLHRGRLIDHIQLVVSNIKASRAFYSSVMDILGIPIVDMAENSFWADELVISSLDGPETQGKLTGRHHFAFQARDREMVDACYRAAMANGGHDNGAPGERPYHPGYYAAFILDPDGNNVEVVYHGEARRSASSVTIDL